jgi:hypothetical protein
MIARFSDEAGFPPLRRRAACVAHFLGDVAINLHDAQDE